MSLGGGDRRQDGHAARDENRNCEHRSADPEQAAGGCDRKAQGGEDRRRVMGMRPVRPRDKTVFAPPHERADQGDKDSQDDPERPPGHRRVDEYTERSANEGGPA